MSKEELQAKADVNVEFVKKVVQILIDPVDQGYGMPTDQVVNAVKKWANTHPAELDSTTPDEVAEYIYNTSTFWK